MSQNSLILPTSGTLSGLAAIQALNNALDTLNTLASGASAPTSPEAGQLWHDTGSGTIWLRDLANTTWMAFASVDETNKRVLPMSLGIQGLSLSNVSGSTLGIASGAVLADTHDTLIQLPSAMTKTMTAFATGSGNGSLDTGTVSNNTGYHVFAIKNPTSGASDVVTSLSATAPSLSVGFTKKRWIGWITITGAGAIYAFTQLGDRWIYGTPSLDLNASSASTSPQTASLLIPSGLPVIAELTLAGGSSNNTDYPFAVWGSYESVPASFGNYYASVWVPKAGSGGAAGYAALPRSIITNNGQVSYRSSGTSGTTALSIITHGFTCPRGVL